MQKIKIKYFTDKIEPLDYIEGKSDWIDMRASEEVTLKAGEFALIPLGVAMELPKGFSDRSGENFHMHTRMQSGAQLTMWQDVTATWDISSHLGFIHLRA